MNNLTQYVYDYRKISSIFIISKTDICRKQEAMPYKINFKMKGI